MKFYFQTKGQVSLTNYEQFRRDLHGGGCEAGTLTGLKLSETGSSTLTADGPVYSWISALTLLNRVCPLDE